VLLGLAGNGGVGWTLGQLDGCDRLLIEADAAPTPGRHRTDLKSQPLRE
jgi:hypothetical protein